MSDVTVAAVTSVVSVSVVTNNIAVSAAPQVTVAVAGVPGPTGARGERGLTGPPGADGSGGGGGVTTGVALGLLMLTDSIDGGSGPIGGDEWVALAANCGDATAAHSIILEVQ